MLYEETILMFFVNMLNYRILILQEENVQERTMCIGTRCMEVKKWKHTSWRQLTVYSQIPVLGLTGRARGGTGRKI